MRLHIRGLSVLFIVCGLICGCAGGTKVSVIPSPAPGAKPRIYIQPVSTAINSSSSFAEDLYFPTDDDTFAKKHFATLKQVFAAAGYDAVDPADVKAVLGTDRPDMVTLRRGDDWASTVELARALHAEYVLLVERRLEGVTLHLAEFRQRVVLVNVGTGAVYEQKSTESVTRHLVRHSQEERRRTANQKVYELCRKLFLEAKDEPFALAMVGKFRLLKKAAGSDDMMAMASGEPIATTAAQEPEEALKGPEPAQSLPTGGVQLGKEELERVAAERAQLAELKRQMSEQAIELQRQRETAERERKETEQIRNSLLIEQQAQQAQQAERQRVAQAAPVSTKMEAKPPVFGSISIVDKDGEKISDRAFSSQVTISGQIEDSSGVAAVFVNGTEASLDENGAFFIKTLLKVGVNEVLMEAYNVHQGKSVKKMTITREKGAPPSADVSVIPDFPSRPRQNDLAVVIGIEKYRHIPHAEFAASDAALMKEYLKATGIPERNIALLSDGDATLSDLKKTLERWLANKVTPESRVIVYFSGHGAPAPATGEAYLVPFEGDPNYLEDTAYPLKRLYENLGKLPARQVTVLLDSCFSGAGGRSVLAQGTKPLVMSRGTLSVPPNVAVLAAAREAQISTTLPERKHGLFTYHLLRALKQGKETLPDIYDYLRNKVEDDAKIQNIQQVPSLLPENSEKVGAFSLL